MSVYTKLAQRTLPIAACLAVGLPAFAQNDTDPDFAPPPFDPGVSVYPDQLTPDRVESGFSIGNWFQDSQGPGHAAGVWRDAFGVARYSYELDMYPGILFSVQLAGQQCDLTYGAVKGVVFRYGEPATNPPVDPFPIGWLEGQFVRAADGRGHFRAHVYDPTVTDPLLLVPPIGYVRGAFGPVQSMGDPLDPAYQPIDPTQPPGVDPGVKSPGGSPAINETDPDRAPSASGAAVNDTDPDIAPSASGAAVNDADPDLAPSASSAAINDTDPDIAPSASGAAVNDADPDLAPAASDAAVHDADPDLAPGAGGAAVNDTDPDLAPGTGDLVAYNQLPDLVLNFLKQDEISGMDPGTQGGLPALIQDLGLGSPIGDDPISTDPSGGNDLTFTAQSAGQMGSVGASLTQTPQVEKGLYVAGWIIWD